MYGHTFVGVAGDQLVVFDAEKVEAKGMTSVVSFDLKDLVNTREVYKVLAYRPAIVGDNLVVVLVENQLSNQKKDRLTLVQLNTSTKTFKLLKHLEAPKVFSACISAHRHHSGFHKPEDNDAADHDNTYYATVSSNSTQDASPAYRF